VIRRFGFLFALWLVSPALAQAPADVILRGAIHTLDPELGTVSELGIRDGRIVSASDTPAADLVGPHTRVIQLPEGAVAVPGLWDAHAHLAGLGKAAQRVDLVGTTSFAQVVERVAARAAETQPGEWVLGRGWDQNDWPRDEFGGEFPTHQALSEAVPDHPVLLTRIDGHAVLVNALAMRRSELTAESEAPAGGEIVRDAQGEPTGVLVDAASDLVDVPPRSGAQLAEDLYLGAQACLRLGLVGVHDAGIGAETLAAYESLYEAGRLPFRVYAMLRPAAAEARFESGPLIGAYEGRLTARAIKRLVDGALGSRGAWLLEPYSDRPDARGLPQTSREELADFTRRALDAGFQTCTHAIGDAGVRLVLDAYEEALGERELDHRLRVEHAQVIAPDDFNRFAALGVLPSMQPTHATSDMPWAQARLGPERVRGAYAWQRLLSAGVTHLPLGSDFPVERPNPLLGLYAAVTRLDADGTSPHGGGGWFPDQRLSRERALRGFTLDACYAAFQEADGGALAPGKWADVSVFDRDLLACEPGELLAAKALYTIVHGEVAYDASQD
jgi:predicted amidohydrolase YtcJ